MAKIDEQFETKSDENQSRSRFQYVLLVIGVVVLAANLRASITAVGPLVESIRAETGLSSVLAGLITTLPLLAFALFSSLAPMLGRRWGIKNVLLASLFILTGGIVLRSVPATSALFVGTALLGSAIALGNVLLPGLIKQDFPRQVGLMTSVYSTVMGAGAALAAGVSFPLAQRAGIGWRGSLLFWAFPAALATLIWLLLQHNRPQGTVSREVGVPARWLWRSALAWQVTLFMGLQSLTFYIATAWFSVIFHSEGMDLASAGWMVSLLQSCGVLGSFVTPLIAGRFRSQRLLVTVAIVMSLAAYAGLLTGITALVPLCCILIGLGQGMYISLALMFFILRTRDTRTASELSGMAQSIGYLLAAVGPLLFGLLHDLTHSWTIPLGAMILATLGLFVVGMGAGRDTTVTSHSAQLTP